MPFIRTAGCNLSCSWCDSAYTWQPGYQYTEMTPREIVDQVCRLKHHGESCTWVSLTGGEPTIQHDAGELVELLGAYHFNVIVETNGLRFCDWMLHPHVFVSCSPKLSSSGQDTIVRRAKVRRTVGLLEYNKDPKEVQYKFVIANSGDLKELPDYCKDVGIDITPSSCGPRVYVQPDGYIEPVETYLAALQELQDRAPAGVLVTPQVHRLVYGPNMRSV